MALWPPGRLPSKPPIVRLYEWPGMVLFIIVQRSMSCWGWQHYLTPAIKISAKYVGNSHVIRYNYRNHIETEHDAFEG